MLFRNTVIFASIISGGKEALARVKGIPPVTNYDDFMAAGQNDSRSLQVCNQENKQKTIYAKFEFEPPLTTEPVLDVIGDVFWDDIDDLRRHGKNGIFHAFPVGFGSSVASGYFGPQATGAGDDDAEQVLFSLWDKKRVGDDGWLPALPFLVDDDIENCDTFDAVANPGKACCKRNCNDCGHSGATGTVGTQCKVFIPAKSGMHLRLNIYRYLTGQTLDYDGVTWTGDVWAVDIYNMITGEKFSVGKILISGASNSGIERISNFYEHIGCTPCDSFDAYTSRAGPWVLKTRSPNVDTVLVGATSTFTLENPPYICTNHAIKSDGAPFLKFASGPSVPYLQNGNETWDKTLYTCNGDDDQCKKPADPKKPVTDCKKWDKKKCKKKEGCVWFKKKGRKKKKCYKATANKKCKKKTKKSKCIQLGCLWTSNDRCVGIWDFAAHV